MNNIVYNRLLLVFILGILCATLPTKAQDLQDNKQKGAASAKPYKPSLYAVPLVFNTPETGWGFGLAGGYAFKLNKNDSLQRPSNVLLNTDYTLNKQVIVDCGFTLFFKEENYQLRLYNSYKKYPDSFWGIGNNTSSSAEERYQYNRWDIFPTFQKRIHKRFFAGIRYRYMGMYRVDWNPNGAFAESNFPGHDGGNLSGAGVLLSWDSRNYVFNPTKGFYMHLLNINYPKFLGSDFGMTHLELDGRFFLPVFPRKQHLIGFNVLGRFNFGDVPFFQMATLGGTDIMRGYFTGRYRDKNALSIQAEYRLPLFWRFGAAAFAGLGEVAPSLDKFSINGLKYSVGGGIRFMVSKRERINVRFDVGYAEGNQGPAFYITAAEAF